MQLGSKTVPTRVILESTAYRQGVADVRLGSKPKFDERWGIWQWAYEMGRLVAAHALSQRRTLPKIPVTGRLTPNQLAWLNNAHNEYKKTETTGDEPGTN